MTAVTITYQTVEMLVEGYFSPGDPGCISGPPENCYPPEPPEFEIEDILIAGASVYDLLQCCSVVANTSPLRHRDLLGILEELAIEAAFEQLSSHES